MVIKMNTKTNEEEYSKCPHCGKLENCEHLVGIYDVENEEMEFDDPISELLISYAEFFEDIAEDDFLVAILDKITQQENLFDEDGDLLETHYYYDYQRKRKGSYERTIEWSIIEQIADYLELLSERAFHKRELQIMLLEQSVNYENCGKSELARLFGWSSVSNVYDYYGKITRKWQIIGKMEEHDFPIE
jgi:hypothetical protein